MNSISVLVLSLLFILSTIAEAAPPGVGTACNADGLVGICLDRQTTYCDGWYNSGNHCPGPSNVRYLCSVFNHRFNAVCPRCVKRMVSTDLAMIVPRPSVSGSIIRVITAPEITMY